MGRFRPRGHPAPDDSNAGSGDSKPGAGGRSRRTNTKNTGGSSGTSPERDIVDALELLGRQLRAVPLGPTDSFRGTLRERLTATSGSPASGPASSTASPPARRSGRPRPRRP